MGRIFMPLAAIAVAPGVGYFPGFLDRAAQEALREEVEAILVEEPLFRPRMPRTGKLFSVMMSNCRPLGWVSDEGGYRYQPTHPKRGAPGRRCRCGSSQPLLRSPRARPRRRPASSISATPARGWAYTRTATSRASRLPSSRCRSGTPRFSASAAPRGALRPAPSASPRATPCRLPAKGRVAFHGVDRIVAGSSTLLPQGGRINLTLRRVTRAAA